MNLTESLSIERSWSGREACRRKIHENSSLGALVRQAGWCLPTQWEHGSNNMDVMDFIGENKPAKEINNPQIQTRAMSQEHGYGHERKMTALRSESRKVSLE